MTKKIKPKTDKEAEKATAAEAKANEEKEAEAKKAAEAEALAAAVQDEFQARGFELVEWVHHNPSVVVGVIAIVLLGGLGFGVWTVVDRGNNTKASAAYAAAQKLWEAPIADTDPTPDDDVPFYKTATERSTAARTAFTNVATQHKGTGAGTLAQLTVGHASLKLGELDAAIAAYNAFLAGSKPKDELRFAGYAGLAAALDAKGDTKGAIKALEDQVALADKTDEDGALLGLARLYVQDGDPVKAKAKVEKLLEDFPESSLKARADELLATLGGPSPNLPKKDDGKKDDGKKDDEKKKL
jgi:tetratricopeptide (TPR) repeat protein